MRSSSTSGAPAPEDFKRVSDGAKLRSLSRAYKAALALSGKPKKKFHVRRADAFKILGIGERTFARLEAEGVVIPSVRGRGGRPSVYDLLIVVPAYIAHVTNRPNNGVSVFDARARRDISQAELNELRVAERRKELLPRTQVVLEGQAFVKAVQAKLRAIPRRLTQAGVPREHEAASSAIVREALEELHRFLNLEDLIRISEETSEEEPDQTELMPEAGPAEE